MARPRKCVFYSRFSSAIATRYHVNCIKKEKKAVEQENESNWTTDL